MDKLKKISESGKLKLIVWADILRDDWQRWTEICPDLRAHSDYDAFAARNVAKFSKAQGLGHRIQKIVIKPDDFLRWSVAKGKGVDSNARAAFALVVWTLRNAQQ